MSRGSKLRNTFNDLFGNQGLMITWWEMILLELLHIRSLDLHVLFNGSNSFVFLANRGKQFEQIMEKL